MGRRGKGRLVLSLVPMRLEARRILASTALIGILACGGGGSNADPAFLAYKEVADKILLDYDVAMNDVATIDTNLINLSGGPANITPDTAVEQLERVFLPKLGQVAKSASEVAFNGEQYQYLADAHAPLTTGLAGKHEAYRAMIDAYKRRDAASFETGFKKLLSSDQLVKKYRSCLQRWSEQGAITDVCVESAAVAPAAPAADPLAPPALAPIPGVPSN